MPSSVRAAELEAKELPTAKTDPAKPESGDLGEFGGIAGGVNFLSGLFCKMEGEVARIIVGCLTLYAVDYAC